MGVVFGAFVAMGFALAFLLDFVVDRSIRRPVDVERNLKMPVLVSIPDTGSSGRRRLPWSGDGGSKSPAEAANGDVDGECVETALAVPMPGPKLQVYAEGLRERVITHFENRNLNHKKPKMVGVTACTRGSGVSTLASGLAAELSKIGIGNVLLVDLNVGQGAAHSFYKGQLDCALDEVDPQIPGDPDAEKKLFLAAREEHGDDKLLKALPSKFTHLAPQLKASHYDYIIFDLPAVSQTSSTARLSGYMDLVLLVLESEKTGQQMATKATALMRESRANVAAVLNKVRPHLPSALSPEL
jgi:Mrp family chromosome partitioning ATPase